MIPKYVTLRIKLSRFPFQNLDAIHLWWQTELESRPLTIFHDWTNPDSTHACSPMTGWRMWNVFVCDGSGSFGLDFPIEQAVFLQFPHFFNHLRPLQKAITNAIPLCEGQNHSAHRQEMPRFCCCSGVMDRWLCCCVWGPNGDPTGTQRDGIIQNQMEIIMKSSRTSDRNKNSGWFWMISCGNPMFFV